MNIRQTARMALRSIWDNKLRSVLAMLGIIIGVASVIAIVSVIQGLSRMIALQIEANGANLITVEGYGISQAVTRKLEQQLDGDLAEQVGAWTHQVSYYSDQNSALRYRDQESKYTQIYFANEQYLTCTASYVTAGRNFTKSESDKGARICLIGDAVRRRFFGAMSPLGQRVLIGGSSFEVVGVINGKFGGKAGTPDDFVLLPSMLSKRMNSSSDGPYLVQAKSADEVEPLTQEIERFLRQNTETGGQGYSGFYVSSNQQMREQLDQQANQMALLVGVIAGISLLVGGIGIMNIMLVSVSERTREIGIRMAIGAKRRDIIGQFLIEAATISGFGGLLGIGLGALGSYGFGSMVLFSMMEGDYMPQIERFAVLPSFSLVLGAFLFSAGIGILFGLYPAGRASKLQPVEALRRG